ncbi:MAG: hypothetical protein ACD_73C00041G0003 [uncultured bacterium]|nr:MAG: hypothetical protein ACD_73C00041G0003 [uncultured bacterium]
MKLLEGKSSEKKQNLEKLLDFGTVMVFVDTRKSGVELPAQHKGNPQLPLNLDYAFQIPDFKVFDDRVEASLSFNRQRYFCIIPLSAIYAISSKITTEAIVYAEDLPKDISLFEAPAKKEESETPEQANLTHSPKLTLISVPENNQDKPEEKANKEDPKPPPKKGHLKLIQ